MSLIRSAAIKCDIVNIVEEIGDIRIYPSKFEYDVWAVLSYTARLKNRVRMIGTETPCVVIKKKSGEDVLSLLLELLNDFIRIRGEIENETDSE